MGIRFHCPSGHPLNVKSFLAGKRGYCPKCGAKLVIPVESEPQFASAKTAGSVETKSAASAPTEIELAPREPLPTGAAVATADQQISGSSGDITKDITADVDAHWYLCPPSGGQYGPVDIDTMKQWIEEGRVTATSLVWRNGWPDWKVADKVFKSLTKNSASAKSSGSASNAVVQSKSSSQKTGMAKTSAVLSDTQAGSRSSRRRQSERTNMTAVVLLMLAVLLLSGALFLALT